MDIFSTHTGVPVHRARRNNRYEKENTNVRLADGQARTYRLGTRLQMTGRWAPGLTLNLEGTRQESAGPQPVNQGLRVQASWGF